MRKQVLIVDDDRDIRETLGDLLSGEGYCPVIAANGEEALRILGRERPGLIILDLMMPVMNGWELLAALARDAALARIPKIVVTAGPERIIEGLGGIPVLRKPVNLGRLFSVIETALAGRDLMPHTVQLGTA